MSAVTVRKSGPFEEPVAKPAPKVPTIELFCLSPKMFPFQPSPAESVKETINVVVTGHPETGQKLAKTAVASNELPVVLW